MRQPESLSPAGCLRDWLPGATIPDAVGAAGSLSRSEDAISEPEPEFMFLSPPDITEVEVDLVTAAMRSGWVAPVGPDLDAFEAELAAFTGVPEVVALASGTSALQLGLMAIGVQPGDEVVVPSTTFAATAFAVVHAGARPVFVDVEPEAWTLDPALLGRCLADRADRGKAPRAIIPVDVFGRPADYATLMPLAERWGVPVLEDAAEALGAEHPAGPVGGFGRAGVLSFNGNKIMTSSGGGALLTSDRALAEKVRYWSTQARSPVPWYEHDEIGFNYRMSNIVAAIGRGQLQRLPDMIARRRQIRARYAERLGGIDGLTVCGDPPWGRSNAWLTTVRFDLRRFPNAPTRVRQALAAAAVESRPVWKPMDRQPVFADAPTFRSGVADAIFADGLCLPSGSAMADTDVDRVASVVSLTLTS